MSTATKQPTAPPPPPSSSAPNGLALPKSEAPTLGKLSGKLLPPRLVINGVEGWGKTSMAAYAKNPAIIMARDETGYATLRGAGIVPDVDAATVNSWGEHMALLDDLIGRDTLPFDTLAIDAMGGIERLCHEWVCQRDFHGNWGEKGFSAFQKGYDVSVKDWLEMLQKLEVIHGRGATILMLSHAQVKSFKNPMGEDFDRYIADTHPKTWGVTNKWADAVLFANFVTIVDKPRSGAAKGIGGADRVVYTERRDAFDAKNRYQMPPIIDIPSDPAQVWPVIRAAMTKTKDSA